MRCIIAFLVDEGDEPYARATLVRGNTLAEIAASLSWASVFAPGREAAAVSVANRFSRIPVAVNWRGFPRQ